MCLILFANNQHSKHQLVVLANRDEFLHRPTAPAQWRSNDANFLAGKDLQAGGTWLGINRAGQFAALTNYRETTNINPAAQSRGALVHCFLQEHSRLANVDYLNKLQKQANFYNGYNLLFGSAESLHYQTNRGNNQLNLALGIHGLSNHLLNTPWPKVVRGKQKLEMLLQKYQDRRIILEDAFALLADTQTAPDADLPKTGVGLEWERILSPLFIQAPNYGTRCSTVLLVDYDGWATFAEKTYYHHTEKEPSLRVFEFWVRKK